VVSATAAAVHGAIGIGMESAREARRALRSLRGGDDDDRPPQPPLAGGAHTAAADKSSWVGWRPKAEDVSDPAGPRMGHKSRQERGAKEVADGWWGWPFLAESAAKEVQSPGPAKGVNVTKRVGWASGSATLFVSSVGLCWLIGFGLLVSSRATVTWHGPAPVHGVVVSS
jgi:hypothetical protein